MIDIKILKKDLKVLFKEYDKIRTIHIKENKYFINVYIAYGDYMVKQVKLEIYKEDNKVFGVNGAIYMHLVESVNELLKGYEV